MDKSMFEVNPSKLLLEKCEYFIIQGDFVGSNLLCKYNQSVLDRLDSLLTSAFFLFRPKDLVALDFLLYPINDLRKLVKKSCKNYNINELKRLFILPIPEIKKRLLLLIDVTKFINTIKVNNINIRNIVGNFLITETQSRKQKVYEINTENKMFRLVDKIDYDERYVVCNNVILDREENKMVYTFKDYECFKYFDPITPDIIYFTAMGRWHSYDLITKDLYKLDMKGEIKWANCYFVGYENKLVHYRTRYEIMFKAKLFGAYLQIGNSLIHILDLHETFDNLHDMSCLEIYNKYK